MVDELSVVASPLVERRCRKETYVRHTQTFEMRGKHRHIYGFRICSWDRIVDGRRIFRTEFYHEVRGTT
jgi:hypothetical protein